jgi:RNA polymerase sigma factor (sigma-70 family)
MRDAEVVASIVAGDPSGLATAYDRYADALFKYCKSLLSDPADAADAVQDTFVIAASRLDGLREPAQFRAWLYAVARNESLRIARSKKRTSALDEAPDVTDDSADVSEHAQRAELRALFEDAAAGLNPGEREVVELQLRQGLEAGEVATVLGVSRNHAHTLLSRARSQLEGCLAVLLVGRAGRDECGELGAMLAGWDGRLTVLLRKRVHRHIEQCATCTARRAFELRPAMLLDLSPGAAMAAGAAESFRIAFGAPPALKANTIALATGHGPAAAAHSTAVLSRAGAFGRQGFPKPAHAGLAGQHGVAGGVRALRSSPRGQAAMAAAVVAAVAIAAAAFALTGRDEHFTPSANPKPPGSAPPAPPPASAAATPAATNRATVSPATVRPATVRAATVRAATVNPTARNPAPTTPARVLVSPAPPKPTPKPTPTPTPPKPTPTKPTPTTAPPSPRASTTSPTPPQPPTASQPPPPTRSSPPSSPPPPPPSSPVPGTLSVLPAGGTMIVVPGLTGSLVSLHATGGTVNWAVSVVNDPNHVVSVSPADAGTLSPADPAITLTVRVSRFVQCGRGTTTPCPAITISPGGATFAVWTGWTLPFPPGGRPPSATPANPPGSTTSGSRTTSGSTTSGGSPPAVRTRRITIR